MLTDWRLHDLRRTMGTIMQEELGVSPYVIGAILNHSPDKVMGVTAVYATGKMMADRRLAMDAWGKRLQSISADNIVPLKKVKQ